MAGLLAAFFIALLVAAPVAHAARSTSPLSLDQRRISFGRIPVGTLVTSPLTVTNTSSTDTVLAAYTFANNAVTNFGITTSTCALPGDNFQLAPGTSCVINVSFIQFAAGHYRDTLQLLWSVNGSSAQEIDVPLSASAV